MKTPRYLHNFMLQTNNVITDRYLFKMLLSGNLFIGGAEGAVTSPKLRKNQIFLYRIYHNNYL